MKKKIILIVFLIFSFVLALTISVSAEEVSEETNEEEQLEEEQESSSVKSLTEEEIIALVEEGVLAYVNGNTKGFLEENLDTILSSGLGALIVVVLAFGLAVFLNKKGNGLLSKILGKVDENSATADSLKLIVEKNDKLSASLISIMSELEEVINQEHSDKTELNQELSEFIESIKQLDETSTLSDMNWFNILKFAFLNDNHFNENTLQELKGLFDKYEEEYFSARTRTNEEN